MKAANSSETSERTITLQSAKKKPDDHVTLNTHPSAATSARTNLKAPNGGMTHNLK